MNRLTSVSYGLILGVAGCLPVSGEIVTHRQAMKLAQQFFNESAGEVTAPVRMVYNGRNLTTRKLFTPFYTFTSPRGGFVIVSAENKTFPILAYSLTGGFDDKKLSDAQRALLRSYARDIERIRYDGRQPEEAPDAWRYYPEYVAGLLHGSDNFVYSPVGAPVGDEGRERLESLMELDRSDDLYSSLYTPAQWYELTDGEFARDGYVLVGLLDGRGGVDPVTVGGRKGDMYRVSFGDTDGDERPWMARLFATEFLSDGMIADLYDVPVREIPESRERPFELYDSFIAEQAAAAAERMSVSSDPLVRRLGGGRFSVTMPGRISLVRVYDMAGAWIATQTYGDTETAWIDLGAQPGGFYVAQIFSEGERPVSFKLYR